MTVFTKRLSEQVIRFRECHLMIFICDFGSLPAILGRHVLVFRADLGFLASRAPPFTLVDVGPNIV